MLEGANAAFCFVVLTFRTLFPESMKVFREVLSNPLGLAIVTPPERVSMLLPEGVFDDSYTPQFLC
jgi:hypothetical protein